MASKNQNFEIGKGADRVIEFTIELSAGVPQNITGATFTWKLVDYYSQNPPLVSKATGSGIAISDAVNGKVQLTLANADTATLLGRYVYEMRMLLTGRDAPVAFGTMTVLPKAGA